MNGQLTLFSIPDPLPVVLVHDKDIGTFVTKMNVVYRLCFDCPICDGPEATQ